MKAAEPRPCLLCGRQAAHSYLDIEEKRYWRCARCALRFLDAANRLGREDEHAHYLLHENDVADPGYQRFLKRLALPLQQQLEGCAYGLDYGCGPAPALASLMEEAGHPMAVYDPFFFPDEAALHRRYDFITCSETAEHFFYPAEEFDRLGSLLKPGGLLAVMTCFATPQGDFAEWHYRRDPTHVVFYERKTFEVMAEDRGWRFDSPAKDIALLRVPT